MAAQHSIVGGPSKFDLSIALLDGDHESRRLISFLLPNKQRTQQMVINQVARESGDGESWLFKGWTGAGIEHRVVNGYYSTRNRQGWIMSQTEGEEREDEILKAIELLEANGYKVTK